MRKFDNAYGHAKQKETEVEVKIAFYEDSYPTQNKNIHLRTLQILGKLAHSDPKIDLRTRKLSGSHLVA